MKPGNLIIKVLNPAVLPEDEGVFFRFRLTGAIIFLEAFLCQKCYSHQNR